MKIILFELESWERDAFSGLQDQHDVTYTRECLNADNAAEYADAEVISTFIYSRPDRATLDAMPNLRFITTRSTGYDHIDLEACRERGIQVAYVPSYGDQTVAEHAIALLLALAHRIPESCERTRRGNFSNQGLTGFEIRGKVMGVIGTGNIGMYVCRLARGLGMTVVATDIKPDEASARDIGFTYKALDEVLAEADVISLHVPATPRTENMISGDQFTLMKDGAVLINSARGSLVDVRALVQALASGKLSGAGLDVLPEEPVIRDEAETLRAIYTREHDLECLLANHALLRLNNVVITPHNAFNTHEAVGRIIETTYGNICDFIGGKATNLVPGA